MAFRKDINGLRAIAVCSVVFFHFNPEILKGGFVGVDIFFVISGFLMTKIIFTRFEQDSFSLIDFYLARGKRIFPALIFLCIVLLIFGFIFLTPNSFKTLGKHVASSVSFISNMVYLRESGYFDESSSGKWLLHTWTLSVEWQFYIIYPLIIFGLKKSLTLKRVKVALIYITLLSFIFSLYISYTSPDAAYYSLLSRSWEMLLGALAFLYPIRVLKKNSKIFESIGIIAIIYSCLIISKADYWPGFLALIPTLATFIILQSENANSRVFGNIVFQKIGTWSYSIYLWHWPLVVVIYHFDLAPIYVPIGMLLSILLGYISYTYIECYKFNNMESWKCLIKPSPVSLLVTTFLLGSGVFYLNGFLSLSSQDYKNIVSSAQSSPLRNKCHIDKYQPLNSACEYFSRPISWAVIGDSHSVEIAYALGKALEKKNIGLKQFSFSSCRPSFGQESQFSECSKWYNEAAKYILDTSEIKNVILNHRFTSGLVGGKQSLYPESSEWEVTPYTEVVLDNLDTLIFDLADKKDNVYIYYPFPELPRNVLDLISISDYYNNKLTNIIGTTKSWYEQRNKFIIDHFSDTEYPPNVHFLEVDDFFCDDNFCFAIRGGNSLYFDDDHPSIFAAKELIKLIDSDDLR